MTRHMPLRALLFLLGYAVLQAAFFLLGRLDAACGLGSPIFSGLLLFLFCVISYTAVSRRKRARKIERIAAKRFLLVITPLLLCYVTLLGQSIASFTRLSITELWLLFWMAGAEECYFRMLGTECFSGETGQNAVFLSLLFGLSHIGNLCVGHDLLSVLGQSLYATAAGFLYLAVYRATGQILWPMLLHFLHNLTLEVAVVTALPSGAYFVFLGATLACLLAGVWLCRKLCVPYCPHKKKRKRSRIA